MSDTSEDPGRAGWTLVQLSELVRRAEQLLLDGITLVGPQAHAGMAPDATIELGTDELRRVAAALTEGVEIAEQLELLAVRLPRDGPVEARYAAVRDAAAADLAGGILDPQRVLLAARLLDVAQGWPALATSLAAGDVVSVWGALTVETLLERFRDADPRAVEQIVAEAGVAPQTRFADCPSEQLDALAAGLRRHASGQLAP
jgi:hypothetical protein